MVVIARLACCLKFCTLFSIGVLELTGGEYSGMDFTHDDNANADTTSNITAISLFFISFSSSVKNLPGNKKCSCFFKAATFYTAKLNIVHFTRVITKYEFICTVLAHNLAHSVIVYYGNAYFKSLSVSPYSTLQLIALV